MLRNYYYDQLTPRLQECYRLAKASLEKMAFSVTFPYCLSDDESSALVGAIHRENPLLYFVEMHSIPTLSNGYQTTYQYQSRNISDYSELNRRLDLAVKEIGVFRNDPMRQIMSIVNWMSRLKYVNTNDPHEHTIYGPLMRRQGVCEAFSLLFLEFCRRFNIDCMMAIGNVAGMPDGHAWNVVNFAGKNYNVDMTVAIDIFQRFRSLLCNVLVPDYILFDYTSLNKPYCGVISDNPYFIWDRYFTTMDEMVKKVNEIGRKERKFTLMDLSKDGISLDRIVNSGRITIALRITSVHRLYIFER